MKKLKNISVKSLSVFLSVALILLSLPLSVFALDVGNQLNENSAQMSDGVYEVVERREESVKHFRLPDGSYIAVQYDTAVHTLDENGEWQDIDNTLLKSGNEFATQNARVKFAKNTNASKTVAVKQGNYQFSFGLIDANKQKAAVVSNPEQPEYHSSVTKFEQLSTLTKLISRVRYENAYSNTDMEYVLVGNDIKENIIVKSQREDGYCYSFELKTNQLTAVLNEDGSVSLNDSSTGDEVFTIPAPFMYDADGNVSDAVHFILTQKQNHKYIVTVVADADWIDAEGRAFPVTIDPTIQYGKDKVSAVHVSSAFPNQNYFEADRLGVSKTGTGSMIVFSKLEAEIELPAHAILTEASVHFERRSAAETTGAAVAVSQVTSSWNADAVTYATKPNYSSTILDYCLTNIASTEYSWDITALMKQWIETPSSNYGLAFWITDDSPSPSQIEFYITNNANDAQKPYYQIKYRDTKGVEEYYDYFTSTADGAGVGYVQAFSGNLVFLHDSVSTTDSLLPYTLGLTFNSVFAGQNVSSSNALMAEGFASLVGYGFKLSTDETLIYQNLDDGGSDNYYYIWSDSDGTEHYFRWYDYQPPGESSVTRYFCDEDGLQLHILEETNENAELIGYKISDDKDNIKHFNGDGYLDYIQDANGNKRLFTRDSANRVTSVSLVPNGSSAIQQLTLTYSGGKLASVTNVQTGLVANFYYSSAYNGTTYSSSGNYLRKITYVYSSGSTYSVAFEYDAQGNLLYAKDLKTGIAIGYSYDAADRVTQVNQYANVTETLGVAGATSGQAAGITYGIKQTTYRSSGVDDVYGNSDDIYTVYHFDDTGKVASVYTTDNDLVYGASNYTYADSDEDNSNDITASVKAAKTRNSVASVMTIGGAATNYLRNPGFENNEGSSLYASEWSNYGAATISTADYYDNDNTYVSMHMPYTDPSNNRTYPYSILQQDFYVEEGTYTFSVAINRDMLQDNAEVKLVIYDHNSDVVAESVPARAYESSYPINTLWERLSVTFDVDEECYEYGWNASIELTYIDQNNTTGTSFVYVDSAMLEKGRGSSTYSLIGNGGFDKYATGWTFTNAALSTTDSFDGRQSVKITGQPTKEANAKTTQNFLYTNAEGPDGETYYMDGPISFVVSGWGKATSVKTEYPENYLANTAKYPNFALKAVFHYYDTDFTSTHYIPFNDKVTDWQFASGSIATQPDEDGVYHYVTSVDIYCCYDYNTNVAYFDNISVSRCNDIVSYYYYNDMGYLTSVESADGTGIAYEYNENDSTEISSIHTSDSTEYETQYDDKHRITLSYDTNGTNNYKNEYTYDTYGNLTLTKMTSLNSSALVIESSTTYSTNQNYFGAMLTETDATGAVNRYFYDSKAQLVGVCDANGNGLIYYYNDYGQLTSAKVATYNSSTNSMVAGNQADIYNSYDEKGQLESITTASADYEYLYDVFGNNTEIKVNGQSLVEYIYATNNGKLLQEEYGNGDSISYIYDGVDRIVGICYNGSQTATFTYSYNANGQVSEHIDLRNDLAYTYEYDGGGKLIQTTVKKPSDNTISYMVKNTYDDQGRLSSVFNYYTDTKAAPLSYTEYAYDEAGNLSVITMGGTTVSLYYTFDSLGRLSKKEYAETIGGMILLTQDYQYETHGNQRTSGQIEKTTLTDSDGETTTEYSYDDAGNITEIVKKQDGTLISEYSYEYDTKGQLIRENIKTNPSSTSRIYNYTMTYTYDSSGNMLYKREYSYTTGSIDGLSYTQTNYSYQSDTTSKDNWNDLLTSYNNQAITYDEIGNPLSYGDYVDYTWDGRQLTQYHYYQEVEYSNGETYVYDRSITYTYDSNGLRASKTYDDSLYWEYTWDGDKLIREKQYSIYSTPYLMKDTRYYYDAEGNPSAFRMFEFNSSGSITNDATYYLVSNIQGDIVAIYDADGVEIYTYEYDAWGNVIKTTSNSGAYASANNPFRYRGYIYDSDIELYYVNSRYYNPQWGRFISADVPEVSASSPDSVLRYNLYAYCLNNPVNLTDDGGMWPSWATKLIVGVAVIATAAVLVAVTGGAAAGPIGCFAAGALKGAVVGATIGAATGAVTGAVEHRIETGSWEGAGEAALESAADGFMTGAITGFISGGISSNQCFVAGTAVLTSAGSVAIENVRAGDMVWASDPETGEVALKEVVQTFRNETTELVHVTVNGEEIVCTNEHPFYSPVKGWTEACQLRAGDILVLVNGEYVIVEQVQHEILESPVATYNFEVQDFHTYYVGESAVLVHNLCGAKAPTSRPASVADGKITGYTKHGLEQAMGREGHGVSSKAILDIVKNPNKVINQLNRGTTKYMNEKGVVVLNKLGKIVTTYARHSTYWRF